MDNITVSEIATVVWRLQDVTVSAPPTLLLRRRHPKTYDYHPAMLAETLLNPTVPPP